MKKKNGPKFYEDMRTRRVIEKKIDSLSFQMEERGAAYPETQCYIDALNWVIKNEDKL